MKKIVPFLFYLIALLHVDVHAQMPQYYIGGGTGTNVFPFSTSDKRIQNLYLPSDFQAMPPIGFITKIYYRSAGTVTNATYGNFEVQMLNTTMSAFPNGTYITPMTTVIGPAATYVIPSVTAGASGGSTGWAELPLATPFFYDNTQNLIIDVKELTASGGFAVWTTTMSSNRRIYGASQATAGNADAYRYDFGFDITPGFPCTGVPTTGLSGPDKICPNKPFTISFTSFYTGVTRQWQKSTNGSTWTNFTGTINATTGAITDAIVVPSWYRCIITCIASSQTYTTTPKFVDIAPFYYCYCEGSFATSPSGTDVGNVKVIAYPNGDTLLNQGNANPFLNNTNSAKTYSNFRDTVLPAPLYHDSSYRFLVTQIISGGSFTAATGAIFIDYNRNGRFDPWEKILQDVTTQTLPSPGMVTDTFTVPDSAGYGLTGMRVIMRSGTTSPDTCTSYTDGETEDYLVDLRYMPCNGKPTTGVIEGDTSMCVGYDYILTDTSYQRYRHGIEHLWQISPDGIYWTDIAGSDTKDTLMRYFDSQPFFYRMRLVCSHTKDTAFTPVHKVNLKPTYKCYCFSQSTGQQIDTADIGGFSISTFSVTDGGSHLGNPRAVRARQDYTDMAPIELMVDSIYEIHVFHTQPNEFHSDGKVTIFMDFDNDHKYDIPEERVYTGFTNVGYHTIIKNIIVPDAAIVDVPTGMRVIINNNVAPSVASDEACGTYTSGETEDYMVMFRRPFNVGVSSPDNNIESVQLYPNPTNDGKFNISFRSAAKEVKIKVTTATGQLVSRQAYSHTGGRFTQQLDLGTAAKGIYFVEVNADGIKAINRVVVR